MLRFPLFGEHTRENTRTIFLPVFSSAIRLMNRLTYFKKFILVGVLFALPLGLVLFLLVGELDDRINFSKKELVGNTILSVLRPILEDLQVERGMKRVFKAQGDFVSEEMLDSIKKKIQSGIDRASAVERETRTIVSIDKKWRLFLDKRQNHLMHEASMTGEDNFESDTSQIDDFLKLLNDVADRSNLILDPGLDSYYLMNTIVVNLPTLTEQIGQARSFGTMVALKKNKNYQDTFLLSQLLGTIARSEEDLQYGFDVIFRENPSLRPRLEFFFRQALQKTDVFSQSLKEDLLHIEQIVIQPKGYWEVSAAAIQANFRLYDATSKALDEVLQKRIDRLSKKKTFVLFFTIGMTLIVVYLVVAFYIAVMGMIIALGNVSKQMVLGGVGNKVILPDIQDEMGDVVQSFNRVAESLSLKADKLFASEKLLLSVLQALPVIVFCKDIKDNFKWTVWNKKAEEVFGITAEECLGKSDYDFFPTNQADWFRSKDIEASQTTETIDIPEEIVSTKKGPLLLHTRKIVIRDTHGEPLLLLGVSEDITERKKSEEKLKKMADSVPGVVYQYSLDKEGVQKFLFMSAFAQSLFGVSANAIVDDFNVLWNLILPEDIDALVRSIQVSAETLKPWTCEFRVKDTQGKLKYIQGDSVPEKPQSDGTIIWNGVLSDITPRKLLEQQLMQSQKMEAVGSLAGGVAHDFNNLLTVINGYADLIARQLKPDDLMRTKIEEIQKAGGRAAGLTAQLLAFSRRQVVQAEVVDLNEQIVDMDQMLRRLITEQIELVTLQATDLGRVKIDPNQFQQIVMNLVVNARDAMPKGGKITLETQNKNLFEDYISDQVKIPAGKYVVLAASDTGCGMSAEVKTRIFEPFFTTKEQGKGTGLGLATCYGIVQQANGYLYVHSVLNQGSTFKVYLPLIEEKGDALPKEQTEDALPRGEETILLVEDESGLRNFAGELMRNLGYEVLEAENGEDALRAIKESQSKKIDLILTDVIMPRMGGKELVKQIKNLYPDIKILMMSGYTGSDVSGDLDESIPFLQKPFSLKQLSLKIRSVLAAGGGVSNRNC